tara:strand:- start:470 stop:1822 length:1353 start_codon:yes stop_codon:yes gene_type:complete
MANSYTNTDWSADALTKATATSSTVDNVALGGTLTVEGDANFDSNTLFVDVSTNRVGVGTATPAADLEIYAGTGDALLRLATTTASASDDAIIEIVTDVDAEGENSPKQARIGVDHSDNTLKLIHGTSFSGGTNGICIDSSGKVGIGTAAPDTNLHIYDATANSPNIYIENVNATDSTEGGNLIFRVKDSDAGAIINDNQVVGEVVWQGYNYDGTAYDTAAKIQCRIDGEASSSSDASDMPGELVFMTSSEGTSGGVERMTINSTGDVSVSGVITSGVTYTQYFGISEINMGTAGYHYVMNNGMMNASPVGGDSSALGNGTDPATTLDFSALTDTDTEDTIAAYWYVPINCTITEVKALATTSGTTSETLRFHVMQYDLDTSSQHGDLANGVLKAHSADIASLTAASLKVGAFTLDSADLTAGKIVIVTIEADDASDKISAQVFINYKAR